MKKEKGRAVDTQVVRRFVMHLGIPIAVRQGLFINEADWLSAGSIQTVVYAIFFARMSCRRGAPSEFNNTARAHSNFHSARRPGWGKIWHSSNQWHFVLFQVLCEYHSR
jgi:hypothetical protein